MGLQRDRQQPGRVSVDHVAVRAALCQATEQLCASQPPGTVTVRQIALMAGVNHGLVHHYFGSKHALVGATMYRVERDIHKTLDDITDPAQTIETVFNGVHTRPSYPRLLSWMLLEGVDPTDHIDRFPMVSHLVHMIGTQVGPSQAKMRTQSLLAFIAGWATTSYFMADITEIPLDERHSATDWARNQAIAIALAPAPDRLTP
jgi:AcrR family transcriptional regulator